MPAGDADVAVSRPVLVTRPAGRGDELVSLLEEHGFVVEHRPLLRLVLETGPELQQAGAQLAAGAFTHLVVTSRTAVEALVAAVGPDLAVPATTEVVAVGAGTAAALAAAGAPATRIASGSGAALVEELPSAGVGASVLFPASAAASPTVPEGLAAKGCQVRRVTAYRPEPVPPPPEVAEALATGGYAAIVLTSAMIARRAADVGIHPSTPIVSIGAPTSAAVRAAGLSTATEAADPTDAALARAVREAVGPIPSGPVPPGPLPPGPVPPGPHGT